MRKPQLGLVSLGLMALVLMASAGPAQAQPPVPCPECETRIEIDVVKWVCMQPKVLEAERATSNPFLIAIPEQGCEVDVSLGDKDFFKKLQSDKLEKREKPVQSEVMHIRVSEAGCLKKERGRIEAQIKAGKTVAVDVASCKVG